MLTMPFGCESSGGDADIGFGWFVACVDSGFGKRVALDGIGRHADKQWLGDGKCRSWFAGSVRYENYTANQLMLPVRFVLGELYMWNRDFLKAAQTYYDLIYWNRLTTSSYANSYNESTLLPAGMNWPTQFSGFVYSDI